MTGKGTVRIEVEVPEDLARRLEAYRPRLVEVLERGLEALERQEKVRPMTREEVLAALKALPFVRVSEEYAPETLTRPPLIETHGKPVSEIVIEDRR